MNLTIDIGNTRNKLAIFKDSNIIESITVDNIDINLLKSIQDKYKKINKAIVSSVKKNNDEVLKNLKKSFNSIIELTSHTPIPIKNLYETKETLGKDRIAAVVGANNIYPNSNVLVIDMGTAITFDFIDHKACYQGGTISPGMNMRFKALNHYTSKLPLLGQNETFEIIGKNTPDAIISGVQNGIIFEVDNYINYFKQKHPNLTTILTGGDAIFFDKKLKNTIFVNLNLNLTGLNTILEYNIPK